MALKRLGYIFGFLIAAVCLYFIKPIPGGFYPPCPFLYLTDLYCPGCGTLRGLNSLLHGDVVTALGYNPLMVLSIPFIIYLLISNTSVHVKGRILLRPHIFSPTFYKVFITTILCFWVIRNISFYPFTILAP